VIKVDSILETVKKMLGLPKTMESFDMDIIIHINSIFSILTQMGVGPKNGFKITGYNDLWSSYINADNLKYEQIKTYMYLKVRSLFDPPSNGNILEAMNRSITELEYRLYTESGGY